MEQSLIHEGITFEALGDAAKTIEPGKEPFHHPTVAGELSMGVGTIFEFSSVRSAPQRNAVADAPPNQRESKGFAVVTPVSGQATGAGAWAASSSGNLHLRQGPRRSGDVGDVALGQMTG